MKDLYNGLWLLIVLCVLALNGCGSNAPSVNSGELTVISSPSPTPSSSPGPQQAVITLFNSENLGQDGQSATYTLTQNVTTSVPSIILRTAGQTLEDGTGVGVDFGNGVGQCFYNADVNSQDVFTMQGCNGGLVAGSTLNLVTGQTITLWGYNHVDSQDSTEELVLNGETNE